METDRFMQKLQKELERKLSISLTSNFLNSNFQNQNSNEKLEQVVRSSQPKIVNIDVTNMCPEN